MMNVRRLDHVRHTGVGADAKWDLFLHNLPKRHLDPSDVAVWREQGMVVQPTHYGH